VILLTRPTIIYQGVSVSLSLTQRVKQSEGVLIGIIDGRIDYLKIEAFHSKGDKKYIIWSDGRITDKMIR